MFYGLLLVYVYLVFCDSKSLHAPAPIYCSQIPSITLLSTLLSQHTVTWKKNTNRKCVKNYGSSNSSANAQKKCREDGPSKCMGVYDSDCDNKGDFYLCEAGYSLRYSRGHCTYTPPGMCVSSCDSLKWYFTACLVFRFPHLHPHLYFGRYF